MVYDLIKGMIMSDLNEILAMVNEFEELVSTARDEKKRDPKAECRNRGDVCVSSSSALDHKEHFPINSIDQARNALSQVGKYTAAPPWYKGSLSSLKELISRKVHSKYPSIGKDQKKKSSLEVNRLITKYAESD
jgi:hypothetical protein